MDIVLKTDEEAWKFLIEMGGEFRIHTNRNGLRVYICVCDRKYAGHFLYFEHRWDLTKPIDTMSNPGRPAYVHPKALLECDDGYQGTETGKTLVECVNKHLKNMTGDILTYKTNIKDMLNSDKCCCNWTLQFKGTLEEFKKLSLKDK